MNILISSGHYYVSDKMGSEPSWGVDYSNHYAQKGHQVYMVAGVCDLTAPLHQSVTVYCFAHRRTTNILIETLLRSLYPIYASLASTLIYLRLRGNVQIVHYVAPTGPTCYDPFFIFRTNSSITYLIGPAFPPALDEGAKAFSQSTGVTSSFQGKILWQVVKTFLPILHRLFLATVHRADYLVCACEEARQYYSGFINPNKIVVIPLGTDIHKFTPSPHRSSHGEDIVILSASNLVYRKRVDLSIQALQEVLTRHPNLHVKLLIAGLGEEKDNLVNLTHKLHLQNYVEFVGFVPYSQMPNYYNQADIFAATTRHEPFGMTVMEALASGLPVVASNVNSMPYIIDGGGLLFERDNYHDLALKLEDLILHPSKLRSMAKKARQRAISEFDWDKITSHYIMLS